ncbi:MAG: DNA-3-methyladenine glycosylase 2 family protein [Holophagaceae bacterium]|nr:DNA-3-methyladenine glycosylase 2 family protein [Holophagaceae bacterium]
MKTVLANAQYEVAVTAPYRLDLTVSVLRRLSTNIVDVLTPQGHYVRALGGFDNPIIVRVEQQRLATLTATIEGQIADHPRALTILRRMLGVDRELSYFDHAATSIPWLGPLALRMRGVKPPRYPSLWEACVNAIVFQQVSLVAASSILRRLILALGTPIKCGDLVLWKFPGIESFTDAGDDVLRAAGLSTNKLAALRRVADALLSGRFDEAALEERPSPDAAALLCQIKGIGPWTATVILLRGLGRLDVFPMNDSSVARNLTAVAGPVPLDIDQVLSALGAQRGMLYYHLLLARLEARGDVGRASVR